MVAVVSPLDEVTQELKTVKETLDSVQASLITSVSLIQGKEKLFKIYMLVNKIPLCQSRIG